MSQAPRLQADVKLTGPFLRGMRSVTVASAVGRGVECEFGDRERFLLEQLDGRRTLAVVSEAYFEQFGRGLEVRSWMQFLGLMNSSGLLEDETQSPLSLGNVYRLAVAKSSFAQGRFVIGSAASVTRAVSQVTIRLRSRPLSIVLLLLVAAMVLHVAVAMLRPGSLDHVHLTVWAVLGSIVLSLAVTCVHELAHGISAVRRQAFAVEFGVRFIPPAVLPYCRVEGRMGVRRVSDRAAIAAAGPFWGLVAALPVYFLWLALGARQGTLLVVLTTTVAVQLLNLLPVPPFDGFLVVEDLTHTVGLRVESLKCAKAVFSGRARSLGYRSGYIALSLGVVVFRILVYLVVLALVVFIALQSPNPWRLLIPICCAIYLISLGATRWLGEPRSQ